MGEIRQKCEIAKVRPAGIIRSLGMQYPTEVVYCLCPNFALHPL